MRVSAHPSPTPPEGSGESVSVSVQRERSTNLMLLGVEERVMCRGTPQCSVFLFVRELHTIV